MEETKTSTRVLLVSAFVLLVILLTGPLGYKFSMVPLEPSLLSVVVALVGGLLVAIVSLVYLVIAIKNDLSQNRNLVLVAIFLGLLPLVIVGPQIGKAQSVPAIHDITTDPENPPAFVALIPSRAVSPNGAEYGGSEAWPADKLAKATRESYPNVVPLMTDLSVAEAVARAESTLAGMGLEIIAVDESAGLVEATATTFWFGFKDDVVVRVTPEGEGSRVDVRSMSRVGQSDIGANAARIEAFLAQF